MTTYMNLVQLVDPLKEKGWHWTNEGKLKRPPAYPYADVPWIYNRMTFQCQKWHEIFFTMVSGERMVHSHCLECYKVVVSPRTIEELVALENWQRTLDVPCKCGIEIRDFVKTKRLYGGYFYTRGVEEGRERYQQVKEWAKQAWENEGRNELAGMPFEQKYDSPMPVILKRGCTEFERALGPSDQYAVTDEQLALEDALDDLLDFDPFAVPEEYGHFPQPDVLKQYVRLKWLQWAHHHGDMTYAKFTWDGKPFNMRFEYFTRPPVTYHDTED